MLHPRIIGPAQHHWSKPASSLFRSPQPRSPKWPLLHPWWKIEHIWPLVSFQEFFPDIFMEDFATSVRLHHLHHADHGLTDQYVCVITLNVNVEASLDIKLCAHAHHDWSARWSSDEVKSGGPEVKFTPPERAWMSTRLAESPFHDWHALIVGNDCPTAKRLRWKFRKFPLRNSSKSRVE